MQLCQIRIQHPVPDFITFTKSDYSFYIDENTDPGTHVGFVQLEPIPRHAEPYVSFLVHTANFSVLTTTGEIQTLSVFDYESEQNYTFSVEAWIIISDRIPPVSISTSANVIVFILDIDDNPPVFQDIPSTLSWLENRSSEEHLYHILARDLDTGGANQQVEFEILNADILDKFRIDNETGDLIVAPSLDREESESYIITIQVSDSATPRNSIQRNINFTLLDINDNYPTIVDVNSDQNYAETKLFIIDDAAEVGTVIANISVMDTDDGNNGTVIFEINTGTPFDIEIADYHYPYTYGHILVANMSLLIPGLYTVNISATDMGEIPLQTSTQLNIRVDYALPDFISFPPNAYHFYMLENSSVSTVIGRVSVEQMTPALDGLVYSIQDRNLEQFFMIDNTSGIITNIEEIDRETHPHLNLTISAFLPSEPSLEGAHATVIITVVDINDNPPIFTQTAYSTVLLTTDISTTEQLTQVVASDADNGSNAMVFFAIEDVIPRDNANDFYIVKNGSIFTDNTNLSTTTYYLNISARDMGEHSLVSIANVTITVMFPVPDTLNFTQPEGYTFNVNENLVPGSIVGRVHLDGISHYVGQHVRFSTSDINFGVNTSTGLIHTLNTFDFEERQSYTFQVMARLVISSRHIDLTSSINVTVLITCLLYTSPSPRDATLSRMPSSA